MIPASEILRPQRAFFDAMTKGPAPGLGDFRHQVALGPFDIDLNRLHPTFQPQGLVLDAGWLYGQFRDEANNIITCLRKVAGYWTGGLAILDNQGADDLRYNPQPTHAGGLEIEPTEAAITWRSGINQPDPAKSFAFTQTLQGCDWREGEILRITGTLLRPGMQWYDCNPDGGLYALHVHKAEGTVLGRTVKGWFGYDFIYHPPHRPWTVGPYPNRLEGAYHTLANEFDDGSVEVGMICYGLEGWTFAIISDGEKLIHCAREVDIDVVRRADGFPEEILYHFDGVRYHWRADPRGRIVGMMDKYGGAYRGSEGHCQRLGDARRVVNGLGWIDFFADSRIDDKLVDRLRL